MQQHLVLRALCHRYKERDLNEADTRAQVIDTVLEQVLDWPKTAIKRELAVHPGFADYVLSNAAGQPALVVEAKREGNYFTLPRPASPGTSRPEYISVRTLLTDPVIRDALTQVRNYCLDIGCTFGCITNGHEWIVFRAFEPGMEWKGLRAFVMQSLDAMDAAFVNVFNALSYRCVSFDGSLNALISRTPLENRETYRAGNEIPVYTRTIDSNRYVQYLRPIATRFFGQIDAGEAELMNECYVSDSNYESAFRSAEALLTDSVTPFLEDFGVRNTKSDEGGGTFGNRIEKSVTRDPRADVVVLFGGKGIGKSTFLRRLLYVRPPQVIRKNAVVVLVDLLSTPEEKQLIDKKIWSELINQLDVDQILKGSRDQLLTLFKDRFEIATKQDLYGLSEQSEGYILKLNSLVASWKLDSEYVVQRLSMHLRARHKGVVVVLDNTDQYPSMQEYCFAHAQKIAKTLDCLAIISMREERFYASTIRGVLDAFQNSGFHLGSPSPHNVFLKRLEFVQRLLSDPNRRGDVIADGAPDADITTIQTLLRNLSTEFRSESSHLANFLTACAHGNIRLALELFRGLLQSRYTNVDEITARRDWTWQIHQVLKPVMIPNRFFYEEAESHVPNIFQLRSNRRSSHFTAMRVLSKLTAHAESHGTAFYSLPQLIADLSNRFHMEEDQRESLDMLLRYGLIEANNRLDGYSESIDSVRATPYGVHLYVDLSSAFTYLDLISTDTTVFESRVCNQIASLAMEEYEVWQTFSTVKEKRIERVEKRIQKTTEFLSYLEREESREAEIYQLTPAERVVPKMAARLNDEFTLVRRSANRQRY